MSYIFDATKPISPERQKVAKALLQRQQMDMMAPAAAPQNVGQGLAALGEGIATGLEMRSLRNQANAPLDAWGDMRTVGQQVPDPNAMAQPMGFGANPDGLFGGLKKLFR
jgi:hypothetical protein